MPENRFAFGQNWAGYAADVGNAELEEAKVGLLRLLPTDIDPRRATFFDIGSGSGLHSVAAARIGFKDITATDYDSESVATTKRLVEAFGVDSQVRAFRDDVLDSRVAEQFDVVYSWGVLHHTGDMWRAIDAAAARVRPGGVFIIAIYRRTPFCGAWRRVKYFYCRVPNAVKRAITYIYIGCLGVARGQDDGSSKRGMKRWSDAVDWLGGYPYESASPAEVVHHLSAQFDVLQTFGADVQQRGLGGSGCAEFVFRKRV